MNPLVPEPLVPLLHRPVAVLGGGVSGRGAAGLVAHLGGTAVIYDRAADDAAVREFDAIKAARHALVVVSPGFAPGHAWVEAARAAGCEVLAEIDFAALAWPGRIIAVTGTNGKTTLTEFLTHALRLAGRDARAVGNIGDAFSDAWRKPAQPDAIAVCEISSFQAETLRHLTPDVTLWTNFAEDHLERHGGMRAYFEAKYTLVRRTPARLALHGPGVAAFARDHGFDLDPAHTVDFARAAPEPRIEGTVFARLPQWENFLLARALWRHLGLDADILLRATGSFALGPHRLARVAEVRGITFWNDSKGTNFHAVEAALTSFPRPVLWIGGGRSKGGDVAGFVARIAPRVRHAFLIGDTAAALASAFADRDVAALVCGSLRDAVVQAFAEGVAGDHVLLSPGFSSFDMFNGYDDRGRRFEAAVADLVPESRSRTSATADHFLSPTFSETPSLS